MSGRETEISDSTILSNLYNSSQNEEKADDEDVIVTGFIAGNRYLSIPEQQNNAQIIYSYFRSLGWTKNAICGMLGNIQSESTINPQIYEGLKLPGPNQNITWGYGLTQWTPATKLFYWAYENNLNYFEGLTQMKRIEYERQSTENRYAMSNFKQWLNYPTAVDGAGKKYCTYTFYDFSKSLKSVNELAYDFMMHYENPSAANKKKTLATRQAQARYWFSFFTGETSAPYAPVPPQSLPYFVIYSSHAPDDNQHRLPIYQLIRGKRKEGEL